MKKYRTILVLLVAFASTFAHGLALVSAQSEGVLLQTLAAFEARQRTRENPAQRESENLALSLANLAIADAALPTGRVRLEEKHQPSQIVAISSDSWHDQPMLLQSMVALATAPRAPPLVAAAAIPIQDISVLLVDATSGISLVQAAPRAPPSV